MENKLKGYFMKKDMPAILMLCAGIVVSVFMYTLVQRLEFKNIQNEFIFNTENYSAAVEKRIQENLNSLHAIEGLYASSPMVTRAKFHTFVSNILPHSSGIHALRWVPRVAGAERTRFETAAIKDGYANFRFTELTSQNQPVTARKRSEYFPVYYSESSGSNEAALGLNISSNPVGRATLEKARDTGAMVLTPGFTQFLEPGHQFAFLAVQPVYRNASLHDTLQERRKNLVGFAVGVFRFGDMVSDALRGLNITGIALSLSDESDAPEGRMLYSNVRQEDSVSDDLTFTKALNVADRRWELKFLASPDYRSTHKTLYSWIILASGFISSFLLALYVLKMKRHESEMEQSKDTMTAVLNSINSAIAIVDSKDMRISAFNKVFIQEVEVSEHEVMGKRCFDIAEGKPLPCGRICGDCPVKLTMRTGNQAARESVHRSSSGTMKYIEISAYPVKDESGNVLHVVQLAQDITGRKEAEISRLEEQQVRRMSAERQVVETQLRMLQAQIEPHFLFNTLANIISLIDKEPRSARRMLQHLTSSLRRSLERSREDVSTLEHEADMLRDYLSIFKMRLGKRLDFDIEIPDELLNVPFPPMLLQPLVENAIKHGIEPKVEGGCVTIKAEKSYDMLRLSVSDTGLGFSDSMNAGGLGLENVRSRLQALYNVSANLILEENIPCGSTAIIEVPL
ncbi:MAG TPA: CHASE domain-containing protein [Nitrospirota bacterium]|nr:CHASE domain-containing protein [Nitrospirota bacterium]